MLQVHHDGAHDVVDLDCRRNGFLHLSPFLLSALAEFKGCHDLNGGVFADTLNLSQRFNVSLSHGIEVVLILAQCHLCDFEGVVLGSTASDDDRKQLCISHCRSSTFMEFVSRTVTYRPIPDC